MFGAVVPGSLHNLAGVTGISCYDAFPLRELVVVPSDGNVPFVASASSRTSSCASKLKRGPDLPRAFCCANQAHGQSCRLLPNDGRPTHADDEVIKGVVRWDHQVFFDVDQIVDGNVPKLWPLRSDFLQELSNRVAFLALRTSASAPDHAWKKAALAVTSFRCPDPSQ